MKLTGKQLEELILEETRAVISENKDILTEARLRDVAFFRAIARGLAAQDLWRGGRTWGQTMLDPRVASQEILGDIMTDAAFIADMNMQQFLTFVKNKLPSEVAPELAILYNRVMGLSAGEIKKYGSAYNKRMKEDFVFLARVASGNSRSFKANDEAIQKFLEAIDTIRRQLAKAGELFEEGGELSREAVENLRLPTGLKAELLELTGDLFDLLEPDELDQLASIAKYSDPIMPKQAAKLGMAPWFTDTLLGTFQAGFVIGLFKQGGKYFYGFFAPDDPSIDPTAAEEILKKLDKMEQELQARPAASTPADTTTPVGDPPE